VKEASQRKGICKRIEVKIDVSSADRRDDWGAEDGERHIFKGNQEKAKSIEGDRHVIKRSCP